MFWYLLTTGYVFLLVAPSTSLSPHAIIYLSLLFSVIIPLLTAAYMVITHDSSVSKPAPIWVPGLHGELANHNFCEEDYYFTHHVAEFHNTWSSLPLIFIGGVGPYYTRQYATKEVRFSASFVSVGAVGVGSALFHASLLRFGQVLDEVPMLLIIFAGIYCFVENDAPTTKSNYGLWLPLLLIATCFTLVAAYLIFYLYEVFLLSFGGGVCMLLYLAISAENKPALATTILKVAFMFIAIGFSCWLLDNFCCTHVHWLRLHVFWHIFTGLSGYMFTLFMITLRASSHQQIPSLVVTSFRGTGWELQNKGTWSVTDRPQFILPYVKYSKKCDGQ